MHVGEISFCDKVAYNIKLEETKKFILTHLEKEYSIRIIQKHHERFNDKSIDILSRNPHLVCLRSNGNPYFLYLLKHNFIQYCIFIDKKIQHGYYMPRMIIVHMMFEDELFSDTVFEGEMVKTNNSKWYFLVNDMLVCKGKHLNDVNLPKRLNMMSDVLQKSYKYEDLDSFRICVKKYFKIDDLNTMFNEHLPALPYTCRGLYFRPLYLKFRDILYNFDDNLIKKVERVKYKTIKQFVTNDKDIAELQHSDETCSDAQLSDTSSTITSKSEEAEVVEGTKKKFMVGKTSTPDVYDLYENGKTIGVACLPTLKLSKYMREATKAMNLIDKLEMDFQFSDKFKKWMPFCL